MVNLDCLLNCVFVLAWALPNLLLEPVLDPILVVANLGLGLEVMGPDLVVVVANLVLGMLGPDLVVLVSDVGPVVDFDCFSELSNAIHPFTVCGLSFS